MRGVPHVVGASEQLGSARKRAGKVTPSAGIRNEAERERNRSTRRLDTFMKELSVPLGRYLAGFPPPGRLHPFELNQGGRKGAGGHVESLKEVAKKLRQLPSLDAGLPTLALVGAPNVGKSSLVQVLSSGTPEVCNYPFTTRSIKMGHFYLDGQKHQQQAQLEKLRQLQQAAGAGAGGAAKAPTLTFFDS
eukprot:XP_001694213.1 nucleolar GTP-binding protein [Chlamydomonas reinhardtii]